MLFNSSIAILNQIIKNNILLGKIPYSVKGYELVKLLYNLGYINNYYIDFNNICISFKYYKNKKLFNNFYFYSSPGHIRSISNSKIKHLYFKKKKNFILSTIKGIITSKDALLYNCGGIILAEFS